MADEKYVLATGKEAEYRLKIVNDVHGPDSRDFVGRARQGPEMSVADIGCGVGKMTRELLRQFGPHGEVVGVDISEAQIQQARKAYEGLKNPRNIPRFLAASAYETGLQSDSFDMVYSRFLLMHVARPQDALQEMKRILKPGGTLALEDGDFTTPFCDPPSAAYDRCFALYRLAGERQKADFRIGAKLTALVQDAGFKITAVTAKQPIILSGAAKRLPEWTLEECAPALIAENLASQEEIHALAVELQQLAANERTQFGMAKMTQIIALKSKRIAGLHEGETEMSEDFDAPLPDAFWEGKIKP